MNRLAPIYAALVLVAGSLVGLSTVALAARQDAGGGDRPQQDFDLTLFMSDSQAGVQRRSFVSDTGQVFAVVEYSNARGQRYQVRLRDLSGIEVFNEPLSLNGDGRQTKAISISHFVQAYERHSQVQSTGLEEGASELENLCKSPPVPPQPTQPPVNPTPGPTPTSTGFERWQALMLDALEASITTSAELDRTLGATGSLPDVSDLEQVVADLDAAQASLDSSVALLEEARRLVNPPSGPGPGTPTPQPPAQPDPVGACALVGEARPHTDQALASTSAAMDGLPDDTSGWRFPPTSARYDAGRFSSCLQYSTDLVQDSSAAASTPWTVGDAGLPALIFPAPDLVDRISLGQLRFRLPTGSSAIYAQTVDVEGVNRQAEIGAFVTDAMCNPVDGVTMTLAVDPTEAGVVEPVVADVTEGVAVAAFTSGSTATLNSSVSGLVCVGPCGGSSSDPAEKPIVGQARFSVIGPPHVLLFHVNPDEINVHLDERANISVEAKDRYNRKVADGTQVHVSIAAGDPGVLAREVRRRDARDMELEVFGKEVDVVTVNGFTIVPPGDDPGLLYSPDLLLMGGDDGTGPVELQASWNGVSAEPAVVFLKSRRLVYLPLIMKAYDVLATPPYSTTPVAPAGRPLATPAP